MLYAGPTKADPSKVNKKTVDAHKALQAGLLPLGRAWKQGSSPAEMRDMAAAKGFLVQDALRVRGYFFLLLLCYIQHMQNLCPI